MRTVHLLRACALILGVLVAATACSPIPEFGETSVVEMYEIGVDAAAHEDYMVAIEAFKRVTNRWPMDDLADDALIGLADAYREIGDNPLAEAEYLRLMVDYPRSSLIGEAEYKLGLVYLAQSKPAALDQEMTRQAIDQFNRFLERYPQSEFADEARGHVGDLRERLARKELAAAEVYVQLKRYGAARIYYESVLSEYPDTPQAAEALLGIVRSYLAEGDPGEALGAYERLESAYGDSEAAARAADEIAQAETEPDGAAPVD